ncbi:hypothetical protein BJX63DRAFT_386758 [Aspergillus granulosus]|uniref:Uncharacterized protein n=1 Tax=Aspergillus granulosus TaxID=176169 RepID=A0ABR4HN75_9EURO
MSVGIRSPTATFVKRWCRLRIGLSQISLWMAIAAYVSFSVQLRVTHGRNFGCESMVVQMHDWLTGPQLEFGISAAKQLSAHGGKLLKFPHATPLQRARTEVNVMGNI